MPTANCPICNREWFLGVEDEAAWYRERFPDRRFGDVVPLVCFECGPELEIGDCVTLRLVRDDSQKQSLTVGVVGKVVDTRAEGNRQSSFCVECPSGGSRVRAWFKRTELFFTPYVDEK
jgi:hypothetical protein